VGNPNAPTLQDNVKDLKGLVALTKGGTYFNGFRDNMGWLGDSYFNLPWNYHELMGDNTCGGEGSNNQTTTIGVPDWIELDGTPATKQVNSSPQVQVIRTYNNRSATGNANNALYYEWASSYQLNGVLNVVLARAQELADGGKINDTQLKTVQTWCHFWKGFAYSNIGTMYYGGIINDATFAIVPDYVSHDAMVTAGTAEYDKAATLLGGLSDGGDYADVLGQLIPSFCQVGRGVPMKTAEWKALINTLKARNILLNHLSPFVNGNTAATVSGSSMAAISAADWATIKTLTDAGITSNNQAVFAGRTTDVNNFFSVNGGSVGAYLTGKNTTTGEKVSERLIQNFAPTDKRLTDNFNTNTAFTNAYSFTTRYSLQDAHDTKWPSGAIAYGTRDIGGYELLMAGSYEENALMGAEARIRTGDIAGGMALINAVKAAQGAGVTATAATAADAMTELVKERRVALAFRGLSFFDLRRWGWTYDVSKGGGAYKQTIVLPGSSGLDVYPNATISYNYMDYWDVPGDETELNPATSGSEWLKNPNF